MFRGFTVTQKGLALLSKLRSGSKLKITRVMIGEGQVPDDVNPRDLEDLVAPVAQATSTKPVTVGTTTSFIVQYRNDLNGGLARDININEHGTFANDPDEGEILLYYANLGAYYEPVPARKPNEPITSREYPVSIGVAEGTEVILDYMASAYMTAEDVEAYCTTTILPMLLAEAQRLIDGHNAFYIGDQEPDGPALWFNTGIVPASNTFVFLELGGDEDDSDVTVGIDGKDRPVMNAVVSGTENGQVSIEIIK